MFFENVFNINIADITWDEAILIYFQPIVSIRKNSVIGLDDVGAGHSNLNRLAMLKPDILKIDMMLVKNINREFFQQEVLKSLVSLSRKIGALVVAEGIETEEEAITALDLGVDMLQGYYFSRPYKMESIPPDLFTDKIKLIFSKNR